MNASSNKRYTFKKGEKLKSKTLIKALFQDGEAFFVYPYKILFISTSSSVKVGFAVSSKRFPRAIDRNRIKRLSRETWRLHKHQLEDYQLAVFLIYTGTSILPYSLISHKIMQILNYLKQKTTLEKVVRS